MKNETDRTTQTPEDVLDELRSLVSEAEKLIGQTPEGSCNCEASVAALRERLEAAQERLTGLSQGARRKGGAGAIYTDEAIREHPYQSIAIAAGVGLLAGILLGRRSSSTPQ